MGSQNYQNPLRVDSDYAIRSGTSNAITPRAEIDERIAIEMRHGGKHDGIKPILVPEIRPMTDTNGRTHESQSRPRNAKKNRLG